MSCQRVWSHHVAPTNCCRQRPNQGRGRALLPPHPWASHKRRPLRHHSAGHKGVPVGL